MALEPSIKYVRNWRGREGHPKCAQLCAKGGGVSRLMCTYARTSSRFMFRQDVCHMVSCIIMVPCLTFIQIRFVRQKRLFFPNEISVCRHKISLFHFKLFLHTKVNKNKKAFCGRLLGTDVRLEVVSI